MSTSIAAHVAPKSHVRHDPKVEKLRDEARRLRKTAPSSPRLQQIEIMLEDLLSPAPAAGKSPKPARANKPPMLAEQPLIITISWRGPYTSHREVDMVNGYGLYLFSGKGSRQRKVRLQYCGMTERGFQARLKSHHKIKAVKRDLEVWLGTVESPKPATRHILERAESLIIYALKLPLNQRGKHKEPAPTTVISYWYDRTGKPIHDAHTRFFPDVLEW